MRNSPQSARRHRAPRVVVALTIGLSLVGGLTALAVNWATQTWDFSVPGEYSVSDLAKIEVNPAAQPGVARLKKLAFTRTQQGAPGTPLSGNTEGFNGALVNTSWNGAGLILTPPVTQSITDTSDADFSLGRQSGTQVVGSGAAASVQIALAPASAWNAPTDPTDPTGAVGQGGALAYPGSGDFIYALRGGGTSAFWRYSISGKSWTAMAITPGGAVVGAGGALVATDANTIYALRGNGSLNFWRYSIAGTNPNTWNTPVATDPADLPAGNTIGAGGALAYPGSGDSIYALQGGGNSAFWRYSISGKSWAAMAPTITSGVNFGGALVYPGAGNSLYAFCGGAARTFLRYDPSPSGPGTWVARALAPASIGWGAALVASPLSTDFIYAFRGANLSNIPTTEFWRYTISTNTWAPMVSTPAPGVGGGGALVSPDANSLYAFAGNTASFWRYLLQGYPAGVNTFTSRVIPVGSEQDVTTVSWTATAPAGTSVTMQMRAGNTSPLDTSWTTMTPLTSGADTGTAFDSYRYLQYQALLSTTDNTLTPSLDDITINLSFTGSNLGAYTSQVLDAGAPITWRNLTWTEGPLTKLGEAVDPLTLNLVGLWSFNDPPADFSVAGAGQSTVNSKTGGTPGQLSGPLAPNTNGPVWTIHGKVGTALEFDGVDDRVSVSAVPTNQQTNWTLEAWVFYRGTGGGANGAMVVYNGTPGTNGYGLWRGDGTNINVISVRVANAFGGNGFQSTGIPLDLNSWNHLAVTYAPSGILSVYKNGQPILSIGPASLAFPPDAPTGSLQIGSTFAGMVDEAAVYTRVLTPAEIAAHYQQGALNLTFQARSGPTATPDGSWTPWMPLATPVPGNRLGLVGLWHFDEPSGTTTTDDSSATFAFNKTNDSGTLGAGTSAPRRVPGLFDATADGFGALSFDGGDTVTVTDPGVFELDPVSPPNEVSVECWVKATSLFALFSKNFLVQNGTTYLLFLVDNGGGLAQPRWTVGTTTVAGSAFPLHEWHHLRGTYDGWHIRLYVDGALAASADSLETLSAVGDVTFGKSFIGQLDEVAIYRQAVPATTELAGSEFAASPIATLKNSLPTPARYAQFRADLRSTQATASPQLSSVTVDAWKYPATTDPGGSPSVTNQTGTPFTLLNSFSESPGGGNQGSITYQLSRINNTTGPWYYYDTTGSTWTSGDAVTPAQRSSASVLTPANVAKFPTQIGAGTLFWKAFLNSDGDQPVELDSLVLGYDNSSFSFPASQTGAVWETGTPRTITWNKLGTSHGMQTVKLEYDPDGDFDPLDVAPFDTLTIVTSTTNTGTDNGNGTFTYTSTSGSCTVQAGKGCYVWAAPTDSSGVGTGKLRVTGADADLGANTLIATSGGFTVARVSLLAPDGGEVWAYGSMQTISWTASPAVDSVMIEYNNGAEWMPLATVPANPPSYPWTINNVSYISTPTVGVSQVRISKAFLGGTVSDLSSRGFTVAQLTLDKPDATEPLHHIGAGTITIQWSSAPPVASLKVEYSNGATTTQIMNPADPVNGLFPSSLQSYAWTIPADVNYLSTAARASTITISTTLAGRAFISTSPGFTIAKPLLTITKPASGEIVRISSPTMPVLWTSEGAPIGGLTLAYSKDGTLFNTLTSGLTNSATGSCTPPAVVAPATGSGCFEWIVPTNAASSTAKLWLYDPAMPNPTAEGYSAVFAVAGEITLLSPATAGMKWAVGKLHTIQWTNSGEVRNVLVEFSKAGPSGPWTLLQNVATSAPYTGGSYSWTPAATDDTTNAVIRVSDALLPAIVTKSSPVFSVTTVSVQSPAGGKRWLVGSPHPITWTQTGLTNVRLDYSTDNGASFPFPVIASTAASTGTFAWTVPDAVKNGAVKVRLQDADVSGEAQEAEATSNAFTIYGQLHVTAHNGGLPNWAVGVSQTIRWDTPVGTIANVKLEYSNDGFVSDINVLGASVPNGPNGGCTVTPPESGCYVWTPAVTSATMKLRVSDAQDAATNDISDTVFTIAGIQVTAPTSAAAWLVGSPQTIAWTTVPAISSNLVTLDYSTDNFACAQPQNCGVIATNQLNGGSSSAYNWASVADAIGTAVKIRVNVTDSPGLIGISQPFTVTGALHLDQPNGGEIFNVGQNPPPQIKWTTTGTIPTVTLQLSKDGGSMWNDIATVPNTGSYAWTVPDAITTQARVRVVDAVVGHPATADASDANFSIRAAFGFVQPDGSAPWAVNETHAIQWTTTGTVGQVKLEYSTDNFATPGTLIGTVSNATGASNWTVPNLVADPQVTPTQAVRLRISDADGPSHPAASAISPQFLAKWYKITWQILNADNSQPLSGLNVDDPANVPLFWPGWSVTDSSLVSGPGLFHYYPYGTFDTTWSKTGYFNGFAGGWATDADKTITVYMESELADTIPYQVRVEYAYTPGSSDTLTLKSWLEKRGLLVGTKVADLTNLGASTINIYDGTTLLTTLTDATPDANGSYDFTWSTTGLVPGNVYFAKASVVFPANPAPGTTRTSGGAVNITIPATSSGGGVTLNQLQTELAPINTAVTTALPGQISSAQTAIQTGIAGVGTQVGGVQATANQLRTDVAGVKATADAIKTETDTISSQVIPGITGVRAYLEDVNTGLPSLRNLVNQRMDVLHTKVKALRQGGIVTGDLQLEEGESATIQYRPVDPALLPNLTIYDMNGNPVLAIPPMALGGNGLYEATVTLPSVGAYRVVVTEQPSAESDGTVDGMTIVVRKPTATAADVAGVAGQLTTLGTQVSSIDANVTNLVATAANIQNAVNSTKTIADQLALDTQSLLAKWGTLDAPALKAQLDSLATQMGTPAQEASMQNALTQLGTLQTNLTNLSTQVGTPAQAAEMQSALNQLTTLQTNLSALSTQVGTPAQAAELQNALTQLGTIHTGLTNLSTRVGAPAQAVDVQNALTQLTSLQGSMTALQNTVGTPAQANALTAVQNQVSALDTALATLSGTQGMTMDTVNTKFDALTTLITSLPAVQVTDQTQRLTDIAAQITSLKHDLTALGTPAQSAGVQNILTQMAAVQQTMASLQSGSTQSDTLLTKLTDLQKMVESAQGSGAAVGFAQNAFNAAREAVTILQQIQAKVGQGASAPMVIPLLGQLQDSLKHTGASVTVIPGELDTEKVSRQIAEVAAQMKALAADKGYNFGVLNQMGETPGDVKSTLNRVQELKAMLDVQRALLERNEKPVVKTWFEAGSIIIKIMAVNPSETESKEVIINSLLPREIKPEHVLDADGLELEYDPQAGAYTVKGTLTLKPKQSIVKSIHLEDIWMVPQERFDALRREAAELMRTLQHTEFEERGLLMADAIERRLSDVEAAQEEPFPTNPELHISRYREHLQVLQMVEADLVSLRQLMVMAALKPGTEQLVKELGAAESSSAAGPSPLSTQTTWHIILFTLVLLAAVSLSFFLVWQRQLKAQLAKQNAASPPASAAP